MFLNPFIIIILGIIGFTYYLHWKDLWNPRRFWNYGAFNTLIYSLIFFLAFVATINVLAEDDKYESYKERIEMYKGYGSNEPEVELCFERDSLFPNNIDYQKDLVDALVRIPETFKNEELVKKRDRYKKKLIAQFENNRGCEKLSAGHLLMFWEFKSEEFEKAASYASLNEGCYSKDIYFDAAKALLYIGEKDKAFRKFQQALDENPNPREAFEYVLGVWESDEEKLAYAMNHDRAIKYANYTEHRHYFMAQGDWLNYFYSLYFGILFRYHPFYVIISFLIVASIGYYLYSIDVFERDSLKRLFISFLIGCFLVPLSLFLYDKYEFGWDWFNGFANNLWLRMTFEVGLTEEMVKIIPFILAVYVFKWANEPIDYIIYAAIGALSFAFLENTMYFDRTEGNVVFARTIFSTIGHVLFSSMIAYPLAYLKFRHKKGNWILVLLPVLLLLASIFHGTYNTIASSSGFVLLVPYMVIGLALLGGFINNGMNNSPHFKKDLIANNHKSVNMIATAFVLLYIVQQCIFIYKSSDFDETSDRVMGTAIFVAIMVMLIAYYLGTFDVVRGKWIPVFEMISKKRVNRNEALGLNCEIYTNYFPDIEHITDYLVGRITDRVIVENDATFFLVRLQTPYTYFGEEYKSCLVGHTMKRSKITNDIEFRARFLVPIKKRVKLAENNSGEDFEYVGNVILSTPKGLQGVNLAEVVA